jgi:hypothetical protein
MEVAGAAFNLKSHKGMKNILTDWNFRRVFYLIGGIWMIAQSIMDHMWVLVPFGIYFAAMGIFKFGCAAGNCGVPYSKIEKQEHTK